VRIENSVAAAALDSSQSDQREVARCPDCGGGSVEVYLLWKGTEAFTETGTTGLTRAYQVQRQMRRRYCGARHRQDRALLDEFHRRALARFPGLQLPADSG